MLSQACSQEIDAPYILYAKCYANASQQNVIYSKYTRLLNPIEFANVKDSVP